MPFNIPSTPNPPSLPVTFRLPARGRDQFFGLTRGYYYFAESEGRISLVRLRSKGRRRGVTLVRTADVLALIEEAGAEAKGETSPAPTETLSRPNRFRPESDSHETAGNNGPQ